MTLIIHKNGKYDLYKSGHRTVKRTLEHAVKNGHTDFTGAYLAGSNLNSITLNSICLSDACLDDCSFVGAELRHVNLERASLVGAVLSYSNLFYVSFGGANLKGANFSDVRLHRCLFKHAIFNDTKFDYGAFPLWCGTLGIEWDTRTFSQLLYHLAMGNTKNCEPEIRKLVKLKAFKEAARIFRDMYHPELPCIF